MEYRIVIENHAQEGDTPVSTNAALGKNPSEGVPADKQQSDKGGNILSNVMVSTNVIKPYVQQAISFSVSKIEMETGSAALQQKAQAVTGVISSASGIVAAGIMGGPAAAGSAAAVMLLQTMLQATFNNERLQLQRRMEQESLSLQRSRLGMSVRQSRGGGIV